MLIFIIICYINNINLIYIYNVLVLVLGLFSIFEYKYNLYFFKTIITCNYIANVNLINGVVLIHPILIYLTYSILIIFIIVYKLYFKYLNKILFKIKILKLKLFNFSFIALFLGG